MAVEAVGGEVDKDQEKLFLWLRHTVTEKQIFVSRYMRLDDPADPTAWQDLQQRIGDIRSQIEAIRKEEKQKSGLLNKAKYHAHRVVEGRGSEEDWKKVVAAVECLVNDDVPASSVEIRDMLVTIIEDMPDIEVPPGFQRVLAEIDRYFATQMPVVAQTTRELSGEVQQVAGFLEKAAVVLIGGESRPYACEALKSAFRLKELIWITTREHESPGQFEDYVARQDVAAVVLAIRWSSHSYGRFGTFA